MLERLFACVAWLLLGAAVVLCIVLLVLVTQYMIDTIKNMRDYNTDKAPKNYSILGRCIIIDKDDILALLVGCVVGFILGVAMP